MISTSQSHKFSLPEDLTYLNMAYMSPLLKLSEVTGIEGLLKKSNPANLTIDDFFQPVDLLKKTFGKLIDADSKQIALTPSVSYAMANAANNISYKTDGEIIFLEEQFPSHYYVWADAAKKHNQSMINVGSGSDPSSRVQTWNANIIKSINENTTAVCMPHVHWTDGSLYNLMAINEACKKHNAYLIIDGTQSVGALPLSIAETGIDVLVVAGYKWLLGHYGLGLAYYSEKFNDGTPIEHNWINKKDSDNFSALVNYSDTYREGAARYSVGEKSNFTLMPMLQSGLEQILEWGVANIQAYCKDLHVKLIAELEGTPFRVPAIGESSSHLTSIRFDNSIDLDKIKSAFAEENIFVSYRGDAIRVSFYVFNEEEDVRKMGRVLRSVTTDSDLQLHKTMIF